MSEAHYILGLDTAGDFCSCALVDLQGEAEHVIVTPCRHGQAEILLPQIQELMGQADVQFSQVKGIVITCGPGSFTGVRVGLSTAKSLALALSIPLYSLTSFEAYALQAASCEQANDIFVVIDSRRDELYIQHFDGDGQAVMEPKILLINDIYEEVLSAKTDSGWLVTGNGAKFLQNDQAFPDALQARFCEDADRIDPVQLCRAVYSRKDRPTENVQACYIRPADISTPKRQLRSLSEIK